MEPINSDKEFEDFLRENSGKFNSFFLLLTIREKMRSIAELQRIANDSLAKGHGSSAMRRLQSHLVEAAEQTLEQFNFLIADSIGDDDEPAA